LIANERFEIEIPIDNKVLPSYYWEGRWTELCVADTANGTMGFFGIATGEDRGIFRIHMSSDTNPIRDFSLSCNQYAGRGEKKVVME